MTATTRRNAASQPTPSPSAVPVRRAKRSSPDSLQPSSSSSSTATGLVRRSSRLSLDTSPSNPESLSPAESPRKRRKRSPEPARIRPVRTRTQSAKAKANAEQQLSSNVAKGNQTEQPSGIMPLSVVDVGVVKGFSVSSSTSSSAVSTPSTPVASSSVSGLKITTPGASSPPLESNPSPPLSPVSPKASANSPPTSPGSQPINLLPIPVSPLTLPISGLPVPTIPLISPSLPPDIPIDPSLLDGEYSEEDAEGEPDDSIFMAGSPLFDPSVFSNPTPTDIPQEEDKNPACQVYRKSTAPRISSPLKAAVSYDSDEDETDMEEIISINARSETGSVSYRVSQSSPNMWETACKWRVWELQKRYSLDTHILRSYEEERADGFWRSHGWPSDLPDGAGRGLLTRSPAPTPCKPLSPSPTKDTVDLPLSSPGAGPGPSTLAGILASIEHPAETQESEAVPDACVQDDAPTSTSNEESSPEASPEIIIQVEKRVTRAQTKLQVISLINSSTSPCKIKGKGKQKAIPSEPEEVSSTNSNTTAPSTSHKRPSSASPNSRKRKSTAPLPSRKPRKSARLSGRDPSEADDSEKAEEDEVESDLLSAPRASSAKEAVGKKTMKPVWWDDDDSLSDLSESDEEKDKHTKTTPEPQAPVDDAKELTPTPTKSLPTLPPLIVDFEKAEETQVDEVDDDDETSDEEGSVELSADQRAEFEGMMGKGDDEAFLNVDLTSVVSPILENFSCLPDASPAQRPLMFPSTPLSSDGSTESTLYIQPAQSPMPSTPLTPYVQLQLTQFPSIPPLSSITVPGLRQLDLSVPKPPNCVELGGRRKGERQLGLVGGWGTPVNRKRRKLWGQVNKGKGKELASSSSPIWPFNISGGVVGNTSSDVARLWAGWTSESDEEEDVVMGRIGILKRRGGIPKQAPPPPGQMYQQGSTQGAAPTPQMMLSPFQPGSSPSPSGPYPQDLINLFSSPPATTTPTASTSTGPPVAAGTRRANPAEVDTPEWEGLMPPSTFYDLFPGGAIPGDGTGHQQGDALFFPHQWQQQMAGHQQQPGQFLTESTADPLAIPWDSFSAVTNEDGTNGTGDGGNGLTADWTNSDAFGTTGTAPTGQWFTSPTHHGSAWVQSTPPQPTTQVTGSTGGELQYALGGGVSC